MIRRLVFAVCVCLCGLCCAQVEANELDPQLLTNRVRELMESTLKYTQVQNHLSSLEYRSYPPNGSTLLQALGDTFSKKFQSRVAAVKHLRDAVVQSYSGVNYNTKQCCQNGDGDVEYDTRFKQQVSTNKVCELVSSSAASNAVRLQNAFRDACVANLRSVPSLKWQYFGSEQGVTTQFPATKASDCGSYDNRFRPWYVQTNVPEPKQVVIVIDKSGSMSATYGATTYMELAKSAAKTVIDTLNPYDQFAVVAFASSSSTYFSPQNTNYRCFQSKFAQATSQNKHLIRTFVDGISPHGGTQYGLALSKAFDFFDAARDNASAKVDRVILFLSDGEPNDDKASIQRTLRSRNDRLSNSVVVMTYGMGNANFEVLREMALQTSHESQTGIFTHITRPDELRNEMASYYNYFSTKSLGSLSEDPVWTVPYLDSWGLGLMMTASLPVYVGGRLVGVAAVDLTIEELLAESSYFKPTELSFAFVVNEAGLVINHPLFPYVTDRDNFYVEATAFERDDAFRSVYESMKSGGSGSSTFPSTRILPRGDGRKYGIRTVNVTSTYYWKQIPGTKFSLCLVLAEEDPQTYLRPQASLRLGEFLYHRLDLVRPSKPCAHLKSYAAQDKSAVALAPRAFVEPELFLSAQTTVQDVQEIADYMEGKTVISLNIKGGVKDMVAATHMADGLWNQEDSDQLSKHVFWRYVATKEGIMRIFPGTQMPNNYDPVVRGWYEQSHANPHKYVITPPYKDAASAISIITLARALSEKNPDQQGSSASKLIGSMGVDIVTEYFPTILTQIYPICNTSSTEYECTLIDQGGFVIMADSGKDPDSAYNKHIIDVEPAIAFKLVSQGIMHRTLCSNIEDALIQHTYLINTSRVYAYSDSSYPHCKFTFYPVQETNAFLLVKDTSGNCQHYFYSKCYCNQIAAGALEPTCDSTRSCNCPCTSQNDAFFPCQNRYINQRNDPLPCTPDTPDLTDVGTPPGVDLNALGRCYKVAFTYPISPTENKSDEVNVSAIIGGVMGGILLLIFVCVFLTQRKPKATPTAPARPAVRSVAATTPTAPSQSATTGTHRGHGVKMAPPAYPQNDDLYNPPPSYHATVGL